MLNFNHYVNTKFIFNDKAEKLVGSKLNELGINRVLLHYGSESSLKRGNLFNIINDSLKEFGIETYKLGGVEPNPRLDLVNSGIKIVKDNSIDFILAIGGGSVIDSAKAIAMGSCYDGDVWDFFTFKQSITKSLPVGVVLTYPASGSESSNVSVINNTKTNEKYLVSSGYIRPCVVFMNPKLTYTLPKFLTSCGIVDMFSHISERYFSPSSDFGVIDRMAEGALRSLVDVGIKVLDEPENYEYRSELMWIGTIAHNDTLGVGREQDWATHVIGNELSALYDITHGATLSIIMPSWMKYVYEDNIERFSRYAIKVFNVNPHGLSKEEIAIEGIKQTKKFFIELGMPTNFKEMSIPTDNIDKMADKIKYSNETQTIGNLKKLNRQDVLNIYKMSI